MGARRRAHESFKYDQVDKTIRQSALKLDIDSSKLAFGQEFTSHMMEVDYSDLKGWGKPSIHGFRPFQIHPANSTIHYALSCFDGNESIFFIIK